ncbi:MAG: 2-oxoglutarate oxidoreductase [Fibrobacteres bacterium]|nr:2-oxoglutarate oxidoreductase [Fibrobacterota bacterium]
MWLDKPQPYCPGCGHGIVHRLCCELLEELGVSDNTVWMAPVGCSILAYTFLDLDVCQPAHGRTPAAATGVKRSKPDSFVLCYQGDGDLAAIGTAEIIHAANRGENFTGVFVNNAIYGMTGGQMAPTTLVGQKATTCPEGRDASAGMGYPIRVCELLKSLGGVTYLARTAVNTPQGVVKTKQALKKAFEVQIRKEGFSLVEILSPCPVNWGMSATDALKFVENDMKEYYPLGEFKSNGKVAEEVK